MAYQFGSVSNVINKEEEVILQQETSSIPNPEITEKPFLKLSKEEIEFLLLTIQSATFKGSEVEKVFTLTLKLQQMYLNS